MITEELNLLKKEFKRIKEMGYVRATKSGAASIEKTFLDLTIKKEDTLEIPDFYGIQIKTKKGYSVLYTTLFNFTPRGKREVEIKRLTNTYGCPDDVIRSNKILNASVQANCSTFVSGRYLFKLHVDYEQEKVFLVIRDRNSLLLEKKVYWDFGTLKEKLERKFQYVAFVKAWSKKEKGVDYYKFYDIDFYKLKPFNCFLKLIEEGTIRVTFKVDVFHKGKRTGELHDYGTCFEIQELDLPKLFDVIKV